MKGTRTQVWFAVAVSIVAFGPIVVAMGAGFVAQAFGCELNEGFYHPCLVLGADIGHALYAAFVMGWLMLLTIWLVPVAAVLWIVPLVGWLRRRAR